MNELQETLTSLATPIVAASGAYCVDVVLRGEHGQRVVQILADTDAGITIDQCAEISRALGMAIEQAGMITGPYRLEVSSPGIDKPLRFLRQLPRGPPSGEGKIRTDTDQRALQPPDVGADAVG